MFAHYYLLNGRTSAIEAAKKAGYAKNTAEKNSHKLLVIVGEYLDQISKPIRQKFGESQETLLKDYRRAFDLAIKKENPQAMVKALDSLAKMLGLNEPEEVKDVSDKSNALTMADLKDILGK